MEIRQIEAVPPHYCPGCDGVTLVHEVNGLFNAECGGSFIPPRGIGGQTINFTDPCGWSAQYTKEPQ